jgi:carotenoid cleavage dioxygenase-like enzyme
LLFNPLDMQMKNVANTGVLPWGNKLLALYEVGVTLVVLWEGGGYCCC